MEISRDKGGRGLEKKQENRLSRKNAFPGRRKEGVPVACADSYFSSAGGGKTSISRGQTWKNCSARKQPRLTQGSDGKLSHFFKKKKYSLLVEEKKSITSKSTISLKKLKGKGNFLGPDQKGSASC